MLSCRPWLVPPSFSNWAEPDDFSPPFELGTPFALTISESVSASTEPNFPFGSAAITDDIGFRLFEADGLTAVAVSAVPEPRTASLIAFSALAVLLFMLMRPGLSDGSQIDRSLRGIQFRDSPAQKTPFDGICG